MEYKEYTFQTSRFRVYEHYIIAEPVENTDISFQELEYFETIAKENFNTPFGLIEFRPQQTSINPVIYQKAKERLPNFVTYALVSNCNKTDRSFFLEKSFMKGIQGALFSTLEEAKEWTEATLKSKLS